MLHVFFGVVANQPLPGIAASLSPSIVPCRPHLCWGSMRVSTAACVGWCSGGNRCSACQPLGTGLGFFLFSALQLPRVAGALRTWLSAAQGSAVKWLHGCRLGIVMIYCCFGLTLLLPFLAGTLVGPPFPVLPKKKHCAQVMGFRITRARMSAMDAPGNAHSKHFQERAMTQSAISFLLWVWIVACIHGRGRHCFGAKGKGLFPSAVAIACS